MTLEVEVKLRVEDPEAVKNALEREGEVVRTVRQEDVYFSHPCRDFAETDEALRLRRVVEDGQETSLVTYKGPKLGEVGKSRVEVEVEVSDGDSMRRILEELGFNPLDEFTIRKIRSVYKLAISGLDIKACLDEVDGLGTFLELEIETDEDVDIDELEKRLLKIARDRLNVEGEVVRKSYLELLMQKGRE